MQITFFLKGRYVRIALGAFLLMFATLTLSAQRCLSGDCQNGEGIYAFPSGAKFKGTFRNGSLFSGTYYYTNGDVYKGPFQQNKRQGRGEYHYASGNVFIGQYEKGDKTTGTFYYVDGGKYEGGFKDGLKSGRGTYVSADGAVSTGYWSEDQFLGSNPDNPIETYALICGIADYQYANFFTGDLNFTVNDARKFYNFVLADKMGPVDPANVKLFLDANATKSNILNNMRRLFAQADENDRVLFFFSGHGERGAFIPHDYNNENGRLLLHDEIKAIYKNSQANVKLLIADACHSGSIRRGGEENRERSAVSLRENIIQVYQEVQVAIMLSCMEDEVSYELADLNQGAFSYFLMEGLQGESDANLDNTVTISELYYYVRNNTYTYIKDNLQEIQRPYIFGRFDRSMPVTVVSN